MSASDGKGRQAEAPLRITDGWVCQFLRYEHGTKIPCSTLADAHGVMFVCPLDARAVTREEALTEGEVGKMRGMPVIAWFRGRVPEHVEPGPGRWTPSGHGLADLTLEPSLWFGDWHGYVKDGVAQ